MRGLGIVYRRELSSYFVSPVAYLIAAAFLLVTAFIFNSNLFLSVTQAPVNPAVVPVSLSFFMIFFGPVLTMRLLAEEAREGTLELLLTAPVSEAAVVIGKFLAAWTYYTLLLAVTLIYQVILILATAPETGQAVTAYIGIWLYGGAALSVGLFTSALSDSQVVAAFLGVSALLLLWLGELAGEIVGSVELARLLRELTLPGHYSSSFAVGLVRIEDVIYFGGLIVVMLFAAVRVVGSRRWR